MKRTVLLIDANPAVQAICSLALNRIGVAVEQVTDPSAAAARIRDLRPHLVICSDDLPELNPVELAEQIKQEALFRNMPFVLFSTGGLETALAKHPVFATVLPKPFKSEQLRSAVQALLADCAQELQSSDTVALFIDDPLVRGAIERLISKHNTAREIFSSEKQLLEATTLRSFPLTVIDWHTKRNLDWFVPEKMGTLVVVTYDNQIATQIKLPAEHRLILRPMSQEKLEQGFKNFLPELSRIEEADKPPLETGEQALLAAKISVAVYQRLLQQQALKNRSWDEASTAVGAETLRICLEVE